MDPISGFSALLFVSSIYIVHSVCPIDFPHQSNCSCYQVISNQSDRLDISDARLKCESSSSHLVFIESPEEVEYLARIYVAYTFYWIGLNGLEFDIMTWDDGSTVQYFNFVDWTEPFGDDSGCYKIAPPGYGVPSNTWHDHDCRDNLGYICETEDPACSYVPTTVKAEPTTQATTTVRETTQYTTDGESTLPATTTVRETTQYTTDGESTLPVTTEFRTGSTLVTTARKSTTYPSN
ncbi:layilin-like [Apostichopus japonicus]|uniref:layilin-like n=1 Tax=Stichopus japonicus TaxID=307972 RepID=UPI003AB69134